VLDDQADFTGHIHDNATGLSYMQARYYDPVLGRFLSHDPVTVFDTGDVRFFNRYAYTANDPVNHVDPDGRVFGVLGKLVKLAVKGGDISLVLAGAKEDVETIFSSDSSGLERAGAIASLGTEVFSPVSLRDAKAGAKFAQKKLGGKCCFVAGTLVETETGLRPIEDIELGDRVLARNPETGETGLKSVTDLIRLNKRQIWEVSLSRDGEASEFFETTDDHPWWIVDADGQGKWKETAELTEGLTVTTADHLTMIVTKVVQTDRVDGTYNLTVADFETYFVGKNKVLVHNCKRTNDRKLPKAVFATDKAAGIRAKELGFRKINERSNGQAVFTDGKMFISRDVDGHRGGAFKGASSVKNLGSKKTRIGTFDKDLNFIGD
jgi:RHS repeat-associated protein